MHKRFGIDWKNTCKDCRHCIKYTPTDRHYYKCELYGVSGSEATDWRLSWMACGKFNEQMDMELFNPVIKTLVNRREPEPQLEGQLHISAFLGG